MYSNRRRQVCIVLSCGYSSSTENSPFFAWSICHQRTVGSANNLSLASPALKRRGACTAQSTFVTERYALACKVGCNMAVGCQTALRAVRDGLIGGGFARALVVMPSLNCGTSRDSLVVRIPHHIRTTAIQFGITWANSTKSSPSRPRWSGEL